VTWTPGERVRTLQDHREWEVWRRERKRQQQRDRRAQYPRIDYYPDERAHALILRLSGRYVGGDYSSVLNRIVADWAEGCHRNKMQRSRVTPYP
jgi:hypothetical protein